MIHESQYWKEELFRSGQFLVDSLTKKRWTVRGFGKLEKGVMLSMYSIRKLYEARKIPTDLFQKKKNVVAYKSIRRHEETLGTAKLTQFYDFSSPTQTSIDVGFLVNQIIHSYYFIPKFDITKSLNAILLNSDITKDKSLYDIDFRFLISLILHISNGDIVSAKNKIIDGKLVTTDVIFASGHDFFTD